MMSAGSIIAECGSTSIIVESISYTWIVNNFSFCSHKKGQYLTSPRFPAKTSKTQTAWRLDLYPRGHNNIDYVEVCLSLLTCNQTSIHAQCQFSLLDDKGDKRMPFSMDHFEFKLGSHVNIDIEKFVGRYYLFDKDTGLLPENRLTLLCEIGITVDVVTNSTDCLLKEMQFNVPDEFQLSNHLKTLFDSQKFNDVILSVDDENFPAHKYLLAARSPVFAAMFEHNMNEKIESRVIVTDVLREVMAEMLTFIYTDYSPNLDNLAEDLLAAADKYDLGKLKIMCEKALFSKITAENAVSILILADLHQAKELKTRAIHFISTRMVDIVKTQSWENDMPLYPKLMHEIVSQMVSGNDK